MTLERNHHEFSTVFSAADPNDQRYKVGYVDRGLNDDGTRRSDMQILDDLMTLLTPPFYPLLPRLSQLHSSLTTALIAIAETMDPKKVGYRAAGDGYHATVLTLGQLSAVLAFPCGPNEANPFLGGVLLERTPDNPIGAALQFDKVYTPAYVDFRRPQLSASPKQQGAAEDNQQLVIRAAHTPQLDPNLQYTLEIHSKAGIEIPNLLQEEHSNKLRTPLLELPTHVLVGRAIVRYLQGSNLTMSEVNQKDHALGT